MIEETWKYIEDYENYKVRKMRKEKSLNNRRTGKEKILKPRQYKYWYLTVNLCKNGKSKNFKIHRLVAKAFIPNPDNKPEVNHKDENKTTNNVTNLEWCTSYYNTNYGTRNSRINSKNNNSKMVYCVELNKTYKSIDEACRELKLFRANIAKACNKQKTSGGYHWEWVI